MGYDVMEADGRGLSLAQGLGILAPQPCAHHVSASLEEMQGDGSRFSLMRWLVWTIPRNPWDIMLRTLIT